MDKEFNKGLFLAGFGSFWWGFFGVLYFKYITYIGHIELVVHRCLWTTFTLILTTFFFLKWDIFFTIIKNKKNLFYLFLSGFLIFINWAVWIYAIATNRIIDASFGYFMMPILSVMLGYIFFKEKLNKEIAELYKTKGINPLGCVLPLIIQMPVWFALFRVLREPLLFIPKEASLFTQLGDHSSVLFFTMDLQIPASEISTWIDRIPYLVLILFVILTALYQQSQLTKKSGNSNNPQAQQMQMIGKIMPLFFGFISWTLPSGLVVYFLTGNIFRIGQQALIVKIEENQQEKTDKKNLTEEDNKPDTSPIKDEKDDPRKNRKKRRRK